MVMPSVQSCGQGFVCDVMTGAAGITPIGTALAGTTPGGNEGAPARATGCTEAACGCGYTGGA